MKVYFEKFVYMIMVETCRYHKNYAALISRNVLITSPGIPKDANILFFPQTFWPICELCN